MFLLRNMGHFWMVSKGNQTKTTFFWGPLKQATPKWFPNASCHQGLFTARNKWGSALSCTEPIGTTSSHECPFSMLVGELVNWCRRPHPSLAHTRTQTHKPANTHTEAHKHTSKQRLKRVTHTHRFRMNMAAEEQVRGLSCDPFRAQTFWTCKNCFRAIARGAINSW